MSSSASVLDPVVLNLIRGESVLDVACGYGRWGGLIASNYWEAGLTRPPQVDGVDAFLPNVELCQRLPGYRQVWHYNLQDRKLSGTWDTVLACEIIEHLPQEEVEGFVTYLESLAHKRIIFSTPNWPDFRQGSDTAVGYNSYEAHLSYVSRRFFREHGYKVVAVGFGSRANLLSRIINKVWPGARTVLMGLPLLFPSFGTHVIAYKDL